MRKNSSVLALLLRVKMKWALVSIACMSALSLALYMIMFRDGSFRLGIGYLVFLVIFSVGSFFTAQACSGSLSGRNTKHYLLVRLQISERKVLLWDIVACTLFFLLLWQAEIITLGLAGKMLETSEMHEGGSQDVVFALYANKFYKNVIPMSDIGGWLHGIVCVLCGGTACACVSMMHTGRKAFSLMGIATMALTSIMFVSGWQLEWVILVGLALPIMVVMTVRQLHDGKERTENEMADC